MKRQDSTRHLPSIPVVRRASGAPAHELRLMEGPGAPRSYPLLAGPVVIGRSEEADVTVDSVELSRRHAEVVLVNGQWSLRDLDSRNGVYLNGVKVHSATLQPGDTVQLGSVVFELREVKD